MDEAIHICMVKSVLSVQGYPSALFMGHLSLDSKKLLVV